MSPRVSPVRMVASVLFLLAVQYQPGVSVAQVAGREVYEALQTKQKVPVVIALRKPALLSADRTTALAQIAAVKRSVLSRLGSTEFIRTHEWQGLSAMAGDVTLGGLAQLLADPDVLRVDLDVGGTGELVQSVPLINAVKTRKLGLTGRGVTVAVLDTGVETDHPDLSDDLVAEQCFCQRADGTGCCPDGSTQQNGPGSAEDDHGHGTNVTGIITSRGTIAPIGVAPDAQIVAVKVFDNQNSFRVADALSGLDWIILNRPDVKVVTMSGGTTTLFTGKCDNATANTIAFADAIKTLNNNGVTFFASSGNSGSATQMPAPACVANTVSVGAVYDVNLGPVTLAVCSDVNTAPDRVVCFTNSNITLDLMAPGATITSTGLGGGTSTLAGTSQACPHAAAAAAVLLEANPSLTPDEIETALKTTGVGVTDPKNGLTFPRIDVLTAVASVAEPDLVEEFVSNPPPTAFGGGGFLVTDSVANQGSAAAASRTRYWLSLDARKSSGDVLLTGSRAVPGLGVGSQSAGSVLVTIPFSTPSGIYFLLACADDLNEVPETNESNNCRASASRVSVFGFFVGTFDLTPSPATVAVRERLTYVLEWTVPSGNWRGLENVEVRIGEGGSVLWLRFDESSGTLRLVDPKNGRLGPAFLPGSANRLSTNHATVYLADSSVQGSGPTGPSVTLTVDLSFKPHAAGKVHAVEVRATNDAGQVQPFERAGSVTVLPK